MAHYHIMSPKGIINRVKHADNERDSDDKRTRDDKRKRQALRMMDEWKLTHFRAVDLKVVEVPSYD